MRVFALSCLLSSLVSVASCTGLSSTFNLPSTFKPPQVFKISNLLRTIDLTKSYVRETIAAVVENNSNEPQAEFFLPLPREIIPKVSYVAAKDKKGIKGDFGTSLVTYNEESPIQYYRILISEPLKQGESITLQINLAITEGLSPVPATITQNDSQYLQWSGTKHVTAAYKVMKQKTKIKFPSGDVPEYTRISPEDPVKENNVLSYGPYEATKPGASSEAIKVRYDYTAPVIRVDKFERDIEVSHWGGNLATEERYWMTNAGAKLKDQFSRVTWASRSYYNVPTSAIKMLSYPLQVGTKDVYYTDEIGNVTTSRFRTNLREAHLELKPRYPVFGGWNYTFVVGWNQDLNDYLRVINSEEFVLKVPFLEGPLDSVFYEKLQVRIILPEGASNVKYSAPIPLKQESIVLHKTFLDTIGRTALVLAADNVVDEHRGKEIIVTYTYTKSAHYRKPLVVTSAIFAVFTISWLISMIDVKIGK